MLDLVVVNNEAKPFQARDRVKNIGRWKAVGSKKIKGGVGRGGEGTLKIGQRWNRKGTKKGSGSVEKVTQGAPERSKVGERGKLWERWRGGEEPGRPANKNAEKSVKAVRERTKLVPQFLEEVKINSISEEGWLGGRSGRGKKRRRGQEREGKEENSEKEEEGGNAKEEEDLSLNSVFPSVVKRLRPVRRRLLAPGRRAGVQVGEVVEVVLGEKKRGVGWLRRAGGSGEEDGALSEKIKERKRFSGVSSVEKVKIGAGIAKERFLSESAAPKKRWRESGAEARSGSIEVGQRRQSVPGRWKKVDRSGSAGPLNKVEPLGSAGLLLKAQAALKRRPLTARWFTPPLKSLQIFLTLIFVPRTLVRTRTKRRRPSL